MAVVEKDILTDEPIDFNDGKFHFVIGEYDIAHIIKINGIKWTRNDIDSANAGRNLKGTMNRGRVCQKKKIEITCVSLNQTIAQRLLRAIDPEYVSVHYYDPKDGERDVQFYSNNVPSTFVTQDTEGMWWWSDISFPLVER